MLPQILKLGVLLGLLVFCFSSEFAAAEAGLPSNNVWQDGPINCYSCDSIEECAQSAGVISKCENNDTQTCLIVFNGDGVVSQRGCSDIVASSRNSIYCASNPEKCPNCISNGCNTATTLNDYNECLACDSVLDSNCVFNPSEVATKKMCFGECMTALYPADENSHRYYLVRSCLNDRDLDDRDACLDGSDSKCISCLGENCNTHSLPETRHSCYHCDGEDCEDPDQEQECVVFNDNKEQCYILFEEKENNVIRMGCISDFADEEAIIDLVKQKALFVCDGEKCNSFSNIAQPNDCTTCNSKTDVNCAIKPTIVKEHKMCRSVPYTSCYERVNAGATERGCLSELVGDDFYNCLTGSDDKCKTCTGTECNEEIIPADRPKCQRCDSQTDASCHSLPAALSVCPTYDQDDSCIALFENGVTLRGCRTEFSCNAGLNCQICKGDGCNVVNIKKRVEEIYGAFQDLPLNCNTCSGVECKTGVNTVRKCEGDIYQDCMTVFDESNEVLRRGCEGVIEAEHQEHCSLHPELCFNCKSNGCNSVDDSTKVQECLYCNAAVNPDCLFDPSAITTHRKCVEGCVSSLYPRKSNAGVYDFVRTCFEDIEGDDRDKCNSENNCVKCTDSNDCNVDILPEEGRLSCWHCEGDDCDLPESKECLGFSENDKCYIYFDNSTFSAVRMGCKSDLTEAEILADVKQYFLCDGENCNDYKNLPDARICYVCDSATDENCAIKPTDITTQSRCQIHPYTECYMRVREDGHTERGCLYNLPTENFLACTNGETDAVCEICAESICNEVIYPSNRPKCYRCNSAVNSDCEREPSNSQVCPLYKADDNCVTKLIDGTTHRGCSSELVCDNKNDKFCNTCAGDNCNTVILKFDPIDDPGLFQDLPLNCYHCGLGGSFDDCVTSSLGKINVCEGNKLQTCTTVFASDGNVIGRGCSDAASELCNVNGNTCFDCKSNGCNLAKEQSDYIDCIFCDGKRDSACIFDVNSEKTVRKCYKSCMTALYPRTDDLVPAYELIRTCLDDMDLDDREDCAAGSNKKCKACSTASCNTDDVGERKSCYHCSGDNCQDPQIGACHSSMDHDQCFVEFDEAGSIVELGCKSKYDPTDVKILVTAKRLWLCDDDNCNVQDKLPVSQRCKICSSRTDPDCAIAPDNVVSLTTCADFPYIECYTRTLENGHTERGCLSSIEGEEFYSCLYGFNATECNACVGDNCNLNIHPENRRSCQVCDSDTSETCETSPQSVQVCLKYNPNENCVSTIKEGGVTVRGCSSQVTCDSNLPTKCQICDTDNCNNLNIKRKSDGKPGVWQPLPLSCYICDDEENCETFNRQMTCTLDHEYCMTVFGDSGAVVRRSCSDAVERDFGSYCDLNPDNCHNCNSNQCNSATSLSDYIDCIYCDSETDSNCALNPTAVGSRRKCHTNCMTALYPRKNGSSFYELTRSCLDDKDLEDQQKCQADDANCIACNDEACNIALLPAERLSCYYCQGESCEDPQPKQCDAFSTVDQCYMLFNDLSDIVQMGCISDLDESFVEENIYQLFMCNDKDNCNDFESIPTPKMCATCTSNVNIDCALNPANVPSVDQCTALPNTQCYTRVNTRDGSTDRGCLSSLSKSDMVSCLSGDSEACTVCLGDRCNIEIFPSDRRRCHRCNSLDDPTCESAPQASSACATYSESESCSTKLVEGITYRGCSSDFTCDVSNVQNCRMCSGADNCNFVDLTSGSIGYPGKWQGTPLNCYTCVGEECTQGLGIVRKCENNDLQTCGTVFAVDGSIQQRGCSDQIYNGELALFCTEYSDQCKFCKSNGCNTATNLDDYVDCLYCDAADNKDCIFDVEKITRTRTCHQKCFTGLYPREQETNPVYELARGCLDDLDLDDREKCENGDLKYCKACEGAKCNTDDIAEARGKCLVCSGDGCEDPLSRECTAFRENYQCFTLFNSLNDVESMGCASDLDTVYIEANKRQLLLCTGDDCNTFENFPKPTACRVCNSINEPDCADPSTPALSAVCSDRPFTECYMRIDDDGVTHRGCLSDIVEDDLFNDCASGDSATCETCHSNNCNSEIYPANRRRCHRCSTANDPLCEGNPQEFASVCPIYYEKDNCVTAVDSNNLIRGCTSEFICDVNDRTSCRICETDNCNTANLLAGFIGDPGKWQGLPLNCYACDGDDCASGSGIVSKCEGNNLQNCVTVFSTDGAVEKRGCSDAITATHGDYCDENPEKCIGCKSNGCNNAKSLNDFIDCYFCDSANSNSCSVNFDSATKTRKCQNNCMVALYPRSSSNDPAYEMSRSCLDDMDIDEREACAAGEMSFCKACDGDRCNTVSLPDERHECYKCVGDNCEDPATQACSAHHPNDQCYILFDKESSISGMGCRSEFEMDVVTQLIKQKQIMLCDGKNCNNFQQVPTPKTCSVCNSETNPLCATNPNLVENIERCSALPYTDCFTRVNAGGHTERGCLSSLESETFYGCLMNTDGLCETCTGDKCNEIDVFPADRWKCHQCSSETNPSCSSTPNNNIACPVYSPTDSCVTNLRNGITTRGCSSNMKCDNANDKRTCRVCNTQGCNTANLEKVSENGEPGKWQDIPISCHTCKGEEDCENGSVFRVCENNPFQNCVTVFNVDGKVSQRGCSDTVEADNEAYCSANAGKCLVCNSNGCNSATSLDEYVECLACDTDTNGDCVNDVSVITNTRLCYKHCMTALYPREEETNPAYGLSRSCYDDMDMDDRDSCAAGEKEYCQICSEAKCNTVTMPEEKRLSCNQCVDDDCQDPQAMSCLTYRPDDKCYVRYDEQRSIIAMGCRSEFSNADADYLLKQKRLFLCEGDNCNTIEGLPAAQTCIICSSRTDVTCAISPESVKSTTTCALSPFTECYSRVLTNGATERGCLSSLYDDEFLSCLDGSSTTCKSCTGNTCNNQVHPEDRTQCHICDSFADPSCENIPNSLSICPKYDAEETCVTEFRNGVTYRGCSSSIECDTTNSKTCNKCSGNGCNTINLAKKQDDNFGKWQDLPLKCLTCSGNDCSSEDTTHTLTCENNNEQDCSTIFDTNGIVVRRGCSDAVDIEYDSYCNENEANCYNCKSNECNTATLKSEFIDCVYCDSYKDLTCITNPLNDTHKIRQCQGGCMSALYPSDGSSDPGYELIRTCLNDKETADQTRCSNSRDANCKACTGANCNVEDFPEDRLSCISCEGENCEDPASQLCPLHKSNDKCFIWFDNENSVSQMGCVSSFRNQDLESLIKTKRIYVCDGADCNTMNNIPVPQKCAACSSADDVFCATNANEISDFNTCNQMPYTSCYTKVADDGSTHRGCLTELPVDDFAHCLLGQDENCDVCTGDGCNREIFPADRQQCHTCTSEDDPKCESFPEYKMPCPILGSSETCVTALSGNVTLRGCKSQVLCDSSDPSTCRSCIGTSCNSIDLVNKVDDGYHGIWQDLPLRCHMCEGDQCLNSLGPAVTCLNNDNQDCMTVFTTDGHVKRRGCSDAVDDYEDLYCRLNPSLCFKCKSNECNFAWSVDEYLKCAFCNSETDPLCTINAENTDFATRSCYKKCLVAMRGQQILRSCLDDKELFEQYNCQFDWGNKECASCDVNNCNKFVFPMDRLACHQCTNAACSRSESQYCGLYDENDSCFAKYENNNVELAGCESSQNKNDIESWKNQNKLFSCKDSNCNALTELPKGDTCVSCDSSKTPNCAQSPLDVEVNETCYALRNGCITQTNTAGHTLRSCLSSVEESEVTSCTANGTCLTCQNNKCNAEIYPADRRKCHICNSVADANCIKSPSSSLICLKYDPDDTCVAKYTDGYTERGCSSDLTCDVSDKDSCQICKDNDCNTAELTGSAGMISSSFILTCILAAAAVLLLKNH